MTRSSMPTMVLCALLVCVSYVGRARAQAEVRIHVDTGAADVSIAGEGFDRECPGECALTVPRGPLLRATVCWPRDGHVLLSRHWITTRGDQDLEVVWTENAGSRTAGAAVLGVGLGATAALAIAAALVGSAAEAPSYSGGLGPSWSGSYGAFVGLTTSAVVVFAPTLVLALYLLCRHDGVDFRRRAQADLTVIPWASADDRGASFGVAGAF